VGPGVEHDVDLGEDIEQGATIHPDGEREPVRSDAEAAEALDQEAPAALVGDLDVLDVEPGRWDRMQQIRPEPQQVGVELPAETEAAEGDVAAGQRWRLDDWRICRASIVEAEEADRQAVDRF